MILLFFWQRPKPSILVNPLEFFHKINLILFLSPPQLILNSDVYSVLLNGLPTCRHKWNLYLKKKNKSLVNFLFQCLKPKKLINNKTT